MTERQPPQNEDTYQRVHRWAEVWSQKWFIGPDGQDLLKLSDGTPAGWVTHVAAYELLLQVGLVHIGQSVERRSLVGRMKGMGLDRALRSWGLRAVRSSRQAPKAGGVTFVLETPSPSTTEPARLVAERVPEGLRSIIAGDPRVLRSMQQAGLPAFAMRLPYRETRRLLASTRREASRVLAAAAASVGPMPFDGSDLAPPRRSDSRTRCAGHSPGSLSSA